MSLWQKNGGVPQALPYSDRDAGGNPWDDLASNPPGRAACGWTQAPDQPTYDPATQTCVWSDGAWVLQPLPPPPAPTEDYTSVYSFKNLLSQQERINIRASTTPAVIDFMDLLNSLVGYGERAVNLLDPATQNAVHALESLGLIGTGRAAQILAKQPPPAA